MAENTFKCTDKGTEYPSRFGGSEIRYQIVEPVAGDPHATLDQFLQNFVAPDADAAQVVADYLNGYGLTYVRNGVVKRFLAAEDTSKLDLDEALAQATQKANEHRVGTVAKKGEGKTGKVKKLEAEKEASKSASRAMYLAMNASLRKQFRPQLEADGIFTSAELDEMDENARR